MPLNVWGSGKSVQFEVHAIELCSREILSRKLISEINLHYFRWSDYIQDSSCLHLSVDKFIRNYLLRLEDLARQNVMTDSGN